jgi:YidC/Oxa1 family membrane protein insertase
LAEFQNPQQEPGTERRLLLVFALTFLIILASQPLLKKYGPKSQEGPRPVEHSAPTTAPPPSSTSEPSAATAPLPSAGSKQASSESTTVVENSLYRITFSNRGARVKSWILKKFNDDAGKPLDLVHTNAAEKYGYPLSLWTYDETLRNKLNSALYVASNPGTSNAPTEFSFEYSDGDVAVRKSFRFDESYVIKVDTTVSVKGSTITALPMWPAGFGDETSPTLYAASRVEYQSDSDIERLAIKKVVGGATVHGPLNWAGVTDQYFAAVFLPDDVHNAALVTLRNPLDNPQDAKHPFEVLGAAVGQISAPTISRLYVGPKALDVLETIPVAGVVGSSEPDLRKLVDFGWLGYIARPLFLWLKWTHDHVIANWGWAIVLQTLIISLALSPLRFMQQKSALEMQRVAPHIKSIQEKYKKYSMGDPRKRQMQEEIAAVYKEHGVNPAAGCLPLLIQMPFLFAYYRMLGVALDLRFAHWLWIKDLSAYDPYYILPIFLVLSMFIMQRMTPMTGMDPSQQKMMMVVMPIMMGFIFRFLAAGLNLYYAESNLISMIQQAVMNRTSTGQEIRRLAEKRARKKDK